MASATKMNKAMSTRKKYVGQKPRRGKKAIAAPNTSRDGIGIQRGRQRRKRAAMSDQKKTTGSQKRIPSQIAQEPPTLMDCMKTPENRRSDGVSSETPPE